MKIDSEKNIGSKLFKWASKLFPLNRSLTGNGNRETLAYIKKIVPELKIHEVYSGT
jgi:aminopeptidase-like protein